MPMRNTHRHCFFVKKIYCKNFRWLGEWQKTCFGGKITIAKMTSPLPKKLCHGKEKADGNHASALFFC